MRAMVLDSPGLPLSAVEIEPHAPGPGQVRLRVRVCGVCRTDLHVVDGELTEPKLPLVLGHQIVGAVESLGEGVDGLSSASAWACRGSVGRAATCRYCTTGARTSAPRRGSRATRSTAGYAELAVADARFCFAIPAGYPDLQAAPLLCAGLIGWRCLKMAGRRGASGDLRLRRRRPHRHAGGALAGPPGVRVHASGRRAGAGVRARAGRRVGGRVRRDAARGAGRRDPLRAGGRAGARWRCGRSRPEARSCAARST